MRCQLREAVFCAAMNAAIARGGSDCRSVLYIVATVEFVIGSL